LKRFITAALLIVLALGASSAFAQKKIPNLNFVNTDKESVTVKHIPTGKPLMLIYFRSDCDHCLHTAQTLKQQAKNYPATIWMVSAEPIETLRTFEDMTGLYDVDNVTVMQDHQQKMHTWFDFSKLPFIVVFDKNRKQLKTYDELPSAAIIKKLLTGK